ncbi:MAG: hypothetical protein WDZ51_06720 [Pirellulaceae bacterium]
MRPLHLTLHARPAGVVAGIRQSNSLGTLETLAPTPQQLSEPLPVTFEQTEAALAALPRMFIEPDGSLVWVSTDPDRPWQLDGMLLDRGGKMLSVELKGSAPLECWEQIFQTVGWPEVDLMFQLTQEAVWIDEATLRRLVGE